MFKGNLGQIGLDVSDGSLEAVQLRSSRKSTSFQMVGWSRIVLPPGAVTAGIVMKEPDVVESLRQLFSKPTFGSLDGRQVVLSIPEHQAYHYVASISSWESNGGLFSQVQSYLAAKLPLPIDSVHWDWRIVGEQTSRVFVYICAIPREVVEGYRKPLKSLGMVVSAVEPQVLSVMRLFWPKMSLPEPVLMIDIGSQETAVATFDDVGIHQSSVVLSGASKSSEQLARALKAELATAEQVIRSIGLRNVKHPKTPLIHQAIKEQLIPILTEAQQHVVYYNVQPHLEPALIKQVLLLGGGSLVPGVAETLAHELKLTVMPPTMRLTIKPTLSPQDLSLLACALGAAVRGTMAQQAREEEINVLATHRSFRQPKHSWIDKLKKKFSKAKVVPEAEGKEAV